MITKRKTVFRPYTNELIGKKDSLSLIEKY